MPILPAQVKFLLKQPTSAEPTLISLVYRHRMGRFVYSTGQHIHPERWSTSAQRASVEGKRSQKEQAQNLNAHLERHQQAFLSVVNTLELSGEAVTNDVLKGHLDRKLGKEPPQERTRETPKPLFVDWIETFVVDAKAGRVLNAKGNRFPDNTLKNYSKLRQKLLAYQTATRTRLTNDSYDMAFYDQFKAWLVRCGYSLNYIGAILGLIKQLLKKARKAGIPVGDAFDVNEFRKLEEDIDSVYLNIAELNALYALDLAKTPRLDRARDVFLMGCYTGLRFTNYNHLKPENILHEGRMLSVQAIKNGPRVMIPLNDQARAILRKYPDGMPRPLTNQKFNEYLKELGKLAGLDRRVERSRTVGGRRTTLLAPKHDLISTHTARRSFATNAVLAGVEVFRIMKITGHKTEGQFWKYVKISAEENALLLLNHPHFGGKKS